MAVFAAPHAALFLSSTSTLDDLQDAPPLHQHERLLPVHPRPYCLASLDVHVVEPSVIRAFRLEGRKRRSRSVRPFWSELWRRPLQPGSRRRSVCRGGRPGRRGGPCGSRWRCEGRLDDVAAAAVGRFFASRIASVRHPPQLCRPFAF
jgi:hypothetical protein